MRSFTKFKDYLHEKLKDPKIASLYIEGAIEENDPEYLQIALGNVIKSLGVTDISNKTGLSRQTIYKMVSPKGNPSYKNVLLILEALNLEIVVRPRKKKKA